MTKPFDSVKPKLPWDETTADSAAQTRDDLRTIGASLCRVEHSRRCEGWYACTCGVAKANAALARVAKAVAS